MDVIQTIADMREWSRESLRLDRSIGFVPTMGYLHDGHISLAERSVLENDLTVMSIFVNPTQFGPSEDLATYPRDLEGDLQKADEAGVQVVFAPSAEEMYGEGSLTMVSVGHLTDRMCGMSRGQAHFRGVCIVVAKLLNIVTPTRMYLGQKDAQQALVIGRMVQDLCIDTEVIVCPIVREGDGLAMSSRNKYLSDEERERATVLYRALCAGRDAIRKGEDDPMRIREIMTTHILTVPDVDIDYLEIVDADTLIDMEKIDDLTLLAGAVFVGSTRLIDNLLVHPEAGPWNDEGPGLLAGL